MISRLYRFLGIDPHTASHTERLVSTLGGILVIFCVFTITRASLGEAGSLLIIPSMGASAVLLFAAPHVAFAQPWNVLGGHVISAAIGVSCALVVTDQVIAASLAVGFAIGAMYYLRCIHPPGGATALAAVIGGETTHALGYQFVFTPVLVNVLVMLAFAVVFNYAFKWRRYPAWLGTDHAQETPPTGVSGGAIEHADLVTALNQLDSNVDISEEDLLRIYDLATGHHAEKQAHTDDNRDK